MNGQAGGGNPQQRPQMQVDLTTTSGVKNSKGTSIFKSAVILRKISKYVAGTDSDAIMPIPVFIDPYNDKIVADGLPLELREELADESFLTGILMDKYHFEKIPSYNEIGLDTLNLRAELIRNNPDFCNKINTIFLEEYEEKQITKSQLDMLPEDSLYFGGFPDNYDKNKMLDFHNSNWEDKYHISNQFRDQRFKYFAHRVIYEEAPYILPKDDFENIHKIIAKQVLSYDNEKWNTLPKSYHQLDTLRNEYEEKGDDKKLTFLDDLDGFLQKLEKKFNVNR